MNEIITKILEDINIGKNTINVNGLTGSSSVYLLSKIAKFFDKRTLVLVFASEEEAHRIYEDLQTYSSKECLSKIALFPAPDMLPYTRLSPEPRLWSERLLILYDLAHNKQKILITSISACLRFLPPKIFVANCSYSIFKGKEVNQDDLLSWLYEMGYTEVSLVEDMGEYSVRGGIIDIWPPTTDKPVRFEREGDLVCSIRNFDPATQRSHKEENSITLIPVTDVPFNKESLRLASQSVKNMADDAGITASQRQQVLEYLREGISFAGIETFMPLFHGTKASLQDYLPKDALIILDQTESISDAANSHFNSINDLAKHTNSYEKVISPFLLYNTFDKWQDSINKFQHIVFNDLILGPEDNSYKPNIFSNADIQTSMNSTFKKEDPLKEVVKILSDRVKQGINVFFTCHTKVQYERLTSLFKWNHISLSKIDIPFVETDQLSKGNFYIRESRISSGFFWPEEKLCIITDEELFGTKVIKKSIRQPVIENFTSFSELEAGDYLVHDEHGIGRYLGLNKLTLNNITNDFLQIEYLEGAKLYLPVYRINLLQRYVGPGNAMPFLDRLGGTRWAQVQKKAGKDIEAIAKDLLNIYATREVCSGYKFSANDTFYEEFAASFPYDETPDQEATIHEVIRDMEIEKPMDRLICGDVGYGKTEVAMRAAYKASMSGKQVAVLVPTTLLAFQHYENFLQRFKNTPINIEMLSRFRSAKEKKAILEELMRGTLDIVIGTHALLQKNVQFKDLGLLIVDEEQRFGVAHKEKVKKIKENIDCLALTATPIPRTLHLSLTGIRDISVINTPPVDRLSISTEIVPFDDAIIRHAIVEEIKRDGQIFFVHNRVDTIRSIEKYLNKLVPEAKIGVAHGQMKERELEDVMTKFLKKEINLLVTTSIIESGLDIPSANTIIINRADTFGLAQLYQIRGRIGRSNVRGYAYLLIPKEGKITPTARRRLTVLQRFTELGSGFQIAMHDLEIRGSGNILGGAQSGHVAAIGYEMYTKLLAKEIKKLQGKKIDEAIDPELNLSISAYIPEDYISETGMRLDLYKRLATRNNVQELDDLEKEICDRFGKMPQEVASLIEVMHIKVMAKNLKIQRITFENKTFVCKIDPNHNLDLQAIARLVQRSEERYFLRPPDRILYTATKVDDEKSIIIEAKKFLSVLMACVSSSSRE